MELIPDFPAARRHMVETQVRRRGIHDPRLLAAMLAIPREEFVPAGAREHAYRDDPVEIGWRQTISQPYMTALMASALKLTGTETVLEVGAGSGYAAAVLGRMAARVYAVEIVPELAEQARRNLASVGGAENVQIVTGDGSVGYPAAAPYDAISVAAAAPDIPMLLLQQLADPGRLVLPLGERENQDLVLIEKRAGAIHRSVVTGCRFVLLRGDAGWHEDF